MATGCPAPRPSVQIVSERINVAEEVRAIPHVGPMLEQQLRNNGLFTIMDVIERFSNTPPYSAKYIEVNLGNLLTSPNRNDCVRGNNGIYQTSDVNQCAFNNIVELLRFAHRFRGQYGIPNTINIPRARRVPMRRRGISVGVQARSVRFCGCKRTQQACENDPGLRCQWHTARDTNLTRGVCTPNVRRRSNSGFRGKGEPWANDSRDPQSSQFSRFGTQDGPGHTVVDGDIYVNRWRIPGRVRRRRSRRRRLSAGEMKRRILNIERGQKNVELRRRFNRMIQQR